MRIKRVDWLRLGVFVATLAIWWLGMEWLGYWKYDVDRCTAALAEDLNGGLEPAEAEALARETCRNLQDAGVVR